MRVLFLDFDGVVHALYGRGEVMEWFIWGPILDNLLSEHPDVKIVVHSSARDAQSLSWMKQRAGAVGERFVDAVSKKMGRWQAIKVYLATHLEVTSYRILDDAADEFPLGLPELVVCIPNTGISDLAVQDQIRRWLHDTRPHDV